MWSLGLSAKANLSIGIPSKLFPRIIRSRTLFPRQQVNCFQSITKKRWTSQKASRGDGEVIVVKPEIIVVGNGQIWADRNGG